MLSVRDERTECTIKIGSLFKKNTLNHLLHYIGKQKRQNGKIFFPSQIQAYNLGEQKIFIHYFHYVICKIELFKYGQSVIICIYTLGKPQGKLFFFSGRTTKEKDLLLKLQQKLRCPQSWRGGGGGCQGPSGRTTKHFFCGFPQPSKLVYRIGWQRYVLRSFQREAIQVLNKINVYRLYNDNI